MKIYSVDIIETLKKTVKVKADSPEAAESIVNDRWKNQIYILNAEDFVGVEFKAKEHIKKEDFK